MTHHDTSMHVLSAVASIGALGKENKALQLDNEKLIKGAANQAATIRTLNERNSSLEAEVTLEKYNVEFLKAQGRKTRVKHRDTKHQLVQARNHLGQALDRAERAERTNAILRAQMDSLMAEHRKLRERHERAIGSCIRVYPSGSSAFDVRVDSYQHDYRVRLTQHVLDYAVDSRTLRRLGSEGVKEMVQVTAHVMVKAMREKIEAELIRLFA